MEELNLQGLQEVNGGLIIGPFGFYSSRPVRYTQEFIFYLICGSAMYGWESAAK